MKVAGYGWGVAGCGCGLSATIIKRKATLAQLVERLIRNQQVAGSIPAGGSSFKSIITSTRYASF